MTKALHHFFSPSGRVGRQSWWLSMVVLLGLLFAVNFAGGFVADMYYCAQSPYLYRFCTGSDLYRGTNPITWWFQYISLAVWIWCTFAISTKRFHDRSDSAWFNLLNLIPIIGGFIWLAMLGFRISDKGANEYGDES